MLPADGFFGAIQRNVYQPHGFLFCCTAWTGYAGYADCIIGIGLYSPRPGHRPAHFLADGAVFFNQFRPNAKFADLDLITVCNPAAFEVIACPRHIGNKLA